MFQWSLRALAKRTPGYVFWRQNTLVELENAKRNYLMSERPVPIAEIARRMVRVKSRYEGTNDFHEKNLLKGEYKYFTGKLCDLRAARATDMIAFIQCAAFFGFWDASQVERAMGELLLQVRELTPNELMCLFVSLPGVRKQRSELYEKTAKELAKVVPELTMEECLAVCSACDDTAPASLLKELLRAVETEAASLTPPQLVDVLDTVSVAPIAVQQQFGSLWDTIKSQAVGGSDRLGCMDVAVLYTTLRAKGDCDVASSEKLLERFVSQAPTAACARSSAMMFSAMSSESLATVLPFAQQMQERVLFLATDFTPAELLAVFKAYLSCLVAMTALVESHAADGAGGRNALATPPCARAELEEAVQHQTVYRHVLAELSEQLVMLLEGASSHVSPAQQMELLEMYASAVAELDAAAAVTTEDVSLTKRRAAGVIVKQLPQTRTAMALLANKLIAKTRSASMPQLIRLLELGDELGPALLPDAVITAALQELVLRDWNLSADNASELCEQLTGLNRLRGEHQRKINLTLLPKIRSFL